MKYFKNLIHDPNALSLKCYISYIQILNYWINSIYNNYTSLNTRKSYKSWKPSYFTKHKASFKHFYDKLCWLLPSLGHFLSKICTSAVLVLNKWAPTKALNYNIISRPLCALNPQTSAGTASKTASFP